MAKREFSNNKPNKGAMRKRSPDRNIERVSLEDFIEKARHIHGGRYSYDKVEYRRANWTVVVICGRHGDFKVTPTKHLSGVGCGRCRESKGEKSVALELNKYRIKHEREKTFDGCRSAKGGLLRFDFYLIDLNILIEFDGEHHFKPLNRKNKVRSERLFRSVVERDEIKNKFALDNGIKLHRIPYNKMKDIPLLIKAILEENDNDQKEDREDWKAA